MSDSVTTAKLMADLQAVVRDAEALLQATANHTGERVEAARKQAQDSLGQAKARLKHHWDDVDANFDELKDEALQGVRDAGAAAQDYVKKNPWASLGIAAGVGLLLGLLITRRD